MQKLVRICGAGLLSIGVAAGAQAGGSPYGFLLHMEAPDYANCGIVNDNTVTCDDIMPDGADIGLQFAFVLAYGWEDIPGWPASRGIGACQFGIVYDEDVVVSGWTLCTGGSEIPQNDPLLGSWPESETGNAITWESGEYFQSNGFAKVGFFVVAADSFGRMTVNPDPRIGDALIAAGDATVYPIGGEGWSSADIAGDGAGDGRRACDEATPVQNASWSAIKSLY